MSPFKMSLAEFDFAIANDTELDTIKMKTLALPHVDATALQSFLDTRLILSFHGRRSGPHKPS